jgi:cytochrome P450 family 307 subfamily A
MPYTEATILETLRVTSSPIVPHVATEDSSIGGYDVPKGTVVFLNNYELNTGEDYWSEPDLFKPERFVVDNQIVKPAHFIPFSTGRIFSFTKT